MKKTSYIIYDFIGKNIKLRSERKMRNNEETGKETSALSNNRICFAETKKEILIAFVCRESSEISEKYNNQYG